MNRTTVESTSLASVGYDSATQTLEVEFKHGGVYQYFDVPEPVYQALLVGTGSYLATNIKGVYRFART